MDEIRIIQGQNEYSKRDHITMVFHYGQIDRWVSFEKGETVINSDNSDEIIEGQEVKISETLFMKWMKLLTLVDRSDGRKEDHHVKRDVSSISRAIGYSSTKGFYKVIKPLYEVGLVDLKETKKGQKKMIDILVYPYPIYADSKVCVLKKSRSWNKRKSFGFSLSYSGVNSRNKNKSTQDKERKYTSERNESTQGSERKYTGDEEQKYTDAGNKSTQETVYKGTLEPVNKSTHSNIYNITKDNNISKDHNILSPKLEMSVQQSLEVFKGEYQVTDDEMTEIILRLENFKPRSKTYTSHRKYLEKTLASVRDEIRRESSSKNQNTPLRKNKRKDTMPKWFTEKEQDDQQDHSMDKPSSTSTADENELSFDAMLEKLKELEKKNAQSTNL